MKRLFDFTASLFGLLLLSPVIMCVGFLIAKKMGRPVLFKQARPGLNSKIFYMQKFRSMIDAVDANDESLPDDQRITPFGHFLRNSSLDELPGLWAVLKGDMSLVGPRPLLVEYLPLYSDEQAKRHNVKPGITGWAQINGRNAISWEQKFELDVWYVNNQNFWLDMKILFLTVKKVLFKENISHDGHVTMEKFTGSKASSYE